MKAVLFPLLIALFLLLMALACPCLAGAGDLAPSTSHAVPAPSWTFDQTVKLIWFVESRCGRNTVHRDGISIGPFGLTWPAMRELVRLHLIPSLPTLQDMMDYDKSKVLAGLYLKAMKKQYHCKTWRGAAGFFHNQKDEQERDKYRDRLCRCRA